MDPSGLPTWVINALTISPIVALLGYFWWIEHKEKIEMRDKAFKIYELYREDSSSSREVLRDIRRILNVKDEG